MELTVLATSFNDEKNILNFLDEFEKQTVKPDYVIIVDGGSKDKTEQLIIENSKNYHFKISAYFGLGRLNIAQGYNEAIRRCGTEWMIVAGIGNEYSLNFCEALLEKQKETLAEVVYTPIKGKKANTFSKTFNTVFVGGEKGKLYGGASNRGVLINRGIYEQIGLHYEKFVYAGEDAEFFDRVKDHGIQMAASEEAMVIWETPHTFKQYLAKSRVNCIAEMQLKPRLTIFKHVISRIILLLIMVMTVVFDWRLIILLGIMLYLIVCIKQKSFSLMAFLLRLHFVFLSSFYYFSLKRYMNNEYHFKTEDIPVLND